MADALESIAQALHHMQEAMRVMKIQMEKTDKTVRGVSEGLSLQRQIILKIDMRMHQFERRTDSSGGTSSTSAMSSVSPSPRWASPIPRSVSCTESAFSSMVPTPPPISDAWLRESRSSTSSRETDLHDRVFMSTPLSTSRPICSRSLESRVEVDSMGMEHADRIRVHTPPASPCTSNGCAYSPKMAPQYSPKTPSSPCSARPAPLSKQLSCDEFPYSDAYPYKSSSDDPVAVPRSMSYPGPWSPSDPCTSPQSKAIRRTESPKNSPETEVLAPVCSTERLIIHGRRLLKAAHYGKVRVVRKLLDQGADPNYSSAGKWTPLLRATAKAHASVVTLLLRRGAEVNAKNCYGFTALHIAAYDDYSGRCVSILLEAGAEIDCKNRFGRTALHYAAESGNLAAVLELIAAGASRTIADDDGKTPFDVAHTACFRRILHPSDKGRNVFPFVEKIRSFNNNKFQPTPPARTQNGLGSPILRYAKEKFRCRFKQSAANGQARPPNSLQTMYNPFIQRQ